MSNADERLWADVLALARVAGLHKAAEEYAQDVLMAAKAAQGLPAPDGFTAEPWPPMRVNK